MIQEKRLVKTLQDLVKIPSHENCDEISGFVANEIRQIGLKPNVDKDGNILASIGSGQGFLLNAHMDTVGVQNYGKAFSGKVSGGKLYGRGSSDDKSGVAAMLEILKVLKEDPTRKQVIFAFTVGEENGGEDTDGAFKVALKIKADYGLILESSVHEKENKMDITTGCKGRFVYQIDVVGRSAHSGTPELGINPIHLSTRLINKIKAIDTPSKSIPGIGDVKSVINVTEIHAREGSNTIPGICRLTVDYRAIPKDNESTVRKRIEHLCKQTLGDSFKISVFESKEGYLETSPKFYDLCSRAVSEAGLTPVNEFSFGWFDGMVFHRAGIPSYKIGPGTAGTGHQVPEYCCIPGLVKGTQAILNIIRRWDSL
jgi:acetylornithine deacetylase/succinyl-diaminopimelate desuccinylase-like protein